MISKLIKSLHRPLEYRRCCDRGQSVSTKDNETFVFITSRQINTIICNKPDTQKTTSI